MKDYCTVFQAETAAIKHAAEELITFNNQQITFWSDSLSALQALSNKIHNNKSINDCHKALTKLADENTVHLKWIKAHTGHWGNEKADELAKAGTVSSNLVCSLVPLNHIKNMINDKVNSLTQAHKRWNTNRHAHTDLILGNHHKKTLKILTNNLNNRTRYRTGICIIIVYKIPYRRAPRLAYRPLGRVRRASKGILHTSIITGLDIRCIPLFAREARVRRRRKIFCDKWYTTYINYRSHRPQQTPSQN